jgi:hypothetical protein
MNDPRPAVVLCIVCGKRNDTPLVLCPACEAWAVEERRKRGEPIRGVVKPA